MCRNIRPLFNFDPPATETEIANASLQFVRKVSGFQKTSLGNEQAFNQAVQEISAVVQKLFTSLSTTALPRNRDVEAAKAHQRSLKRFGLRKSDGSNE